ncbi:hypothetical protein L1889_02360 [Paenalcaligenes niemegkensis]|uniref:hypothetical protein n=1 Tax=Paenalcaligenes niemegkensis TaxID=2895469 RepID=UPI001EE82AA2|nr:hypothetical protein [Paenalcaligenes niemegkensis]MCQ9615695.1 hypothetical protein [Paenalcaligenes niemegkensis]
MPPDLLEVDRPLLWLWRIQSLQSVDLSAFASNGWVIVGLGLSQAGFTKLLGSVYPMVGVVGLILITAIAINWLRTRKPTEQELLTEAKDRIRK